MQKIFLFEVKNFNWNFSQIKYILILVLVLFANCSFGQDTIKVMYKSSFPIGFTKKTYDFDVVMNKNKKCRRGGEQMKEFVFDKPGFSTIYPITIHEHSENHDCTNIHLPEKLVFFTEKFNMKFIDSTFRLNSPIIKNQSTEGDFVEIQVFVECFNNSKIELQNFKLETAGIGTQISGILDSKYIKLKKGINTLKYNLKGICSLNSYIQFDFFDNANNPHSISLPSPIQNN